MSAMRNLLEGLGYYRLIAAMGYVPGIGTGASSDTWVQGSAIHDNGVILVDVGNVGAAMTLVIQHSHDNSTWATHSTCNIIVAAGGYIRHIRRFRRYVRIQYTLTGQGNYFSVWLIGNRCRREPVSITLTQI